MPYCEKIAIKIQIEGGCELWLHGCVIAFVKIAMLSDMMFDVCYLVGEKKFIHE